MLQGGRTEFINTYLTESLGYTIEEAVSDSQFWRDKICGGDVENYEDLIETCFMGGEEFRVERSVQHKDGHFLTFIDHAIPGKDERGEVRWVDGIMMDITELKRLQERTLRTEEVRLLGEISARMAHEIRNPLSAAGGVARRLRDTVPEGEPHYRLVDIIVEEIARIEMFLNILFASIRPFELDLTEVDMNGLLLSLLERLAPFTRSREIGILKAFSPDLPCLQGDHEHLNQAFQSLLKHAIISTPEGSELRLSTSQAGDHLSVSLRHAVSHLAEDDLEP